MPLARQERVIDYMRSQLHPPPGVRPSSPGSRCSPRRPTRRCPLGPAPADAAGGPGRRRAGAARGVQARAGVVVPLIPIALATGWSALILYLIGIPLNPMSATLGTLVIAISTEFSVLLSERFRQERQAGYELSDALARTYRSTGRAVLASGVTAIAGFGVLIFSNITMLRDFGFVTLIDLSVSLVGVLVLLPAVLALSERDDLLEAARGSVRRAIAACRGRAGALGSRERVRGTRRRGPQAPSGSGSGCGFGGDHRTPATGAARDHAACRVREAVPVDHRHHRADARDRLLGAAVRLARRRQHRRAARSTPAFLRRPARRLHAQRRRQPAPPCTLARHDHGRSTSACWPSAGRSCWPST